MIKKISINNIATFKEQVEVNPRRVNYIYGGNGSGKTTISRLINNKNFSFHSVVEWENNELDTLVYNQDFIKDNFEQDKIKGIFTLGQNVPDVEEKIAEKNSIRERIQTHINSLTNTLEKKTQERTELIETSVEDCWTYKQRYSNRIKNALTGYIGKKRDFFEKCILEQSNTRSLLTIEELEDQYNSLYNRNLEKIDEYLIFDITNLKYTETMKIFQEPIIGNSESIVGELISYLNNSDWVNQGLEYFNNTIENKCPFCQQTIDSTLAKTIIEYFDTTYEDKTKELDNSITQYKSYFQNIFNNIENICSSEISIYDLSGVEILLETIKSSFEKNMLLLAEKQKNKSISVELASLEQNMVKIREELNKYLEAIKEHNLLVDNIKNRKQELTDKCWRFISNESSTIIKRYTATKSKTDKVIDNLQKALTQDYEKLQDIDKEIKDFESQITSVKHSVNEINKILKGFHFTGFELKEANEKGHYQIVREDGSLANKTLSEGEYTFITFLYFFYLIKGSNSETGITNKKIVVIDDPISSLDSSVLFIVSNLVKSLIDEILGNYRASKIRQLFISTHNIYFHKEVSFKGSRNSNTKNEFFWLIYKTDNISRIKTSTKNPINTTYAILWDEIKNPVTTNKITIFNNLRRILEYYFKIIGDYNYEEIVNKFEFQDQQTCKALISWINDGSHFINDDLLVETEIESVERYLKIFKDIFDKLGHISHYKMMMDRK